MARKDITDAHVCAAAEAAWPGMEQRRVTIDVLAEMTGEPAKVCRSALQRAELRGLVAAGGTIDSAWPTDAGRSLLHAGMGD